MSESPTPYRSGMAAGLGVVLLSAAILATVDVIHTDGGALGVLACWALIALPVAIGVGAVLAADEGADIAFGAVDTVDLRRLVQLGEFAFQPCAQAAWTVVVQDDPRIGVGAGIVWQQRDFGQAA